jgi:Resolvase, N terminal domain
MTGLEPSSNLFGDSLEIFSRWYSATASIAQGIQVGAVFSLLLGTRSRSATPRRRSPESSRFLRVSTIDQTTANQERELREIASRMGCEIVKIYKDHRISGAKGRDKRPAFDALCRQQGLDTTTPAGKAMFQMMGVFAEFERAMIQERVRAGLARARSEGKCCAGETNP